MEPSHHHRATKIDRCVSRRGCVTVVVIALIVAACGGADDEAATSTTAPITSRNDSPVPATTAPATTVPAITVPTPLSTVESDVPPTSTDPAPTDTSESLAAVSSILETAASPIGWSLAPGGWIADTFEPALAFEIDTPWVVTRQSPDAIQLTDADRQVDLSIVRPLSLLTTAGPIAPPTDLTEFVAAQSDADLLTVTDITADERMITDLEVVIRPPDDRAPVTCPSGPACTAIAFTLANELIYVRNHIPFHVLTTNIG